MTNPDYTVIALVTDRSGSMSMIASDMDGAIENLIKEQKELPGQCQVLQNVFDTVFDRAVPLTDINDFVPAKIIARGMTALYDAIGITVTELGADLRAMPEADRPGKVLIVIITDGLENSSSEYTTGTIKDLITQQRETYNWDFVFLGANQDAVLTGESMGISGNSSLTYAPTAQGAASSMVALGQYVSSYRSAGAAEFTEEDRTQSV
jgi:uncharacterized protein YegL